MLSCRGARLLVLFILVVCSICAANIPVAAQSLARHSYDRTDDGAWAVAGSSEHDGHRGTASVYRRAGRSWVLDATLAPPARGPFARFGASVAMEGNLLVVGAPWDEGWRGAAYVYERIDGRWTLIARLTPDATVGDRFGSRVAIAARVVSLGADGGAVARFRSSRTGWIEVERIAAGIPLAAGRTVDASLLEAVAAEEARGGRRDAGPSVAIDPPAFVRASDGTYEDRTEIRWAAVSAGPLVYKVYRRTAGSPPSSNVLIRVASQDDSLYSDVSGTPGVEYTYCVTVLDMASAEGAPACDNGRRIIFPPTGYTASDATFERRVRLAWSDRSGVEAGYRILRNGLLLRNTLPSTEAFDDSSAVPGTVYSYDLIAFDAGGNTTAPLTDTGSSAHIGAPLQVSASDGQSTNRVVITWVDATALEASYRVYRSSGGAPALLATRPRGTTTYDDSTAAPGTVYQYCVAAVDSSDQESARSCDAGGVGILPGATLVRATDATFDDKVRVTWQDASGTEDGFFVYRMPAGTPDSILVGNVGAGVTTFDDHGGSPGTPYSYCVVAFSNQGGRSVPVCDDGLRAVVLAPASVQATDGAFEDRVDITWESSSTSVVLFKVYRGSTFIRSVAGDRRAYSDDGGASGVTTAFSVRAVTALGVESPATADSGSRRILEPVSVRATDDEFEDRVAVTWTDRSAIEDGFFVYRRQAGTGDPPVRVAARSSNSTTWLDAVGVPGQAYDYFVAAFQAYGTGHADTTESARGTDVGRRVLASPTFVAATEGRFEDKVELSWVDNSRYEEAYHVWRRNMATNDSSRIAVLPPNASRHVDQAIEFGVTYAYSVFAVDSLGGAVLGRSPAGTDAGSTSLLPALVVSASDLYPDRVVVAWIDQSGIETAYRISRDGVVIGSTAANVTTFTDQNALPNTTHTYCVRSVAATDSSDSNCDTGARAPGVGDPSAAQDFNDRIAPAVFADDFFGWSLGVDGQRLVAGAPQTTSNGSSDSRAIVYARSDTGYVLEQVLQVSGTFRWKLGGAVALHGNSAVVAATGGTSAPGFRTYFPGEHGPSASQCTGPGCSAFFFFERDTTSGLANPWSMTQPFGDMSGVCSVDMDAHWAVIGGTGGVSNGGSDASVRFYPRTGGSWGTPQTRVESSQVNGRHFGAAVALSGNTTIVGATSNTGWTTFDVINPAVYVFTLDQGQWTQTQTLTNPDGRTSFGHAVAIDGDRAVVGDIGRGYDASGGANPGRAYVYERNGSGPWNHVATLEGDPTKSTIFGFSVAVRGDSIMVGAPGLPYATPPTGPDAVYLFTRRDGQWIRSEVRDPCPSCPSRSRQLGWSVKTFDGLLAAGAPGTDPGGARGSGSVELRDGRSLSGPGTVSATDADYRDKVQIVWTDPFANETAFKVYRDGSLIATTEPNIRTYLDFDAEPGRTYEYCVTAVLDSLETSPTCDFGRRPPDGNITGRIATLAGGGISGAQVGLDPTPNRALLFDGSGAALTVSGGLREGSDNGVLRGESALAEANPSRHEVLFDDEFTVELWYRGHASGAAATLLRHSTATTADLFAVRNPANLTVVVNGTPLATNVAVDDGAWHHIAIARVRSSGALQVTKDGQPAFAGVLAAGARTDSAGTLTFGSSLTGALDDIRIWSRVRPAAEIDTTKGLPLIGNEPGLAAYWPLDSREGLGAEDPAGNRYGRLVGGAQWIGEAAPLLVFAMTDDQGNYVLPKLRYGTSTTFKVTPEMTGHQYEPAFKTITLSTGSPVQNEVAFSDITTYTVTGFVRYPGLSCPAANIPILVDGEVRATTDGNGRYAVRISPGAHRIEPRLAGHTFLPAAIDLPKVERDLADQSFDETTLRRLTGTVGGGCGVPIGTLTVRIDSENGCFTRTFDASTGFDEPLPPLKFFARVTHVTGAPGGVDAGQVLEFFDDAGAREVDLTSADQTLDFKYRAPLRVVIEGLPDPTPGCAITVPVIAQTERHPLTIRVFEDYGTSTCPVDTGTVTVFDEILDQEETPVTLVIENGLALVSTPNGLVKYVTIGNRPNIFPGRQDSEGNDRSYQKSLTVVAEVEGQRPVTKTIWAIVTGHRPRAATFTALSEGIPLFILRDPPGDHSYSSLAEGTSLCSRISNTLLRKASTGFDAKAVLGINIELGLFVCTRVLAQAFVQGGIELGVEWKSNDVMEICGRTTEEFRTSSENLFIGRDGDLYVGIALNLLFAKTDVIKVEGCQVVASEDVTIGVDDVETVYAFTDWHIRNVIIPQLEDLARLSPADSFRYNSARRNWEAHLALNDSLKIAAPLERNRSFSAGADYAFSATVDTTLARDWSVNVFADANYGAGFDFEVSGSGAGFSYFSRFGLSYERGGATTGSSSRTTSYALSDNDIGDFFSVNVKNDPLYGTPVFDLLGGTSSCPWEPWPDPITGLPRTQPVDGPVLTIEPPVRLDVPPDAPAVFTLSLTNDSQAGQLREYQLFAVQENNPGGAVLRLDGDAFSASGVSFFLEPGQTRQATLTVERGPSQYFYEDLKIVMVPPCEYELFRSGGPLNLSNSVLFSAGFEAPCSDIKLLRPNPGWSVKAGTDTLELILKDFELAISEDDSLISVGAEYQRAGTDVWLPIGSEILLSRLTLGIDGRPASVVIPWPVANVPEATYSVRAFTRCPNGRNYSTPATGVIDRSSPLVFGTPQPADGTLSFGEDIAITFNEDLDCASANPTTVRLETTASSPQRLDAQATCNGRTVVIAAAGGLAAYEGQQLRATVTGIRDLVGNLSATTSWTFIVRQGEFAWDRSQVSQDVGFGAGGRIAVNLVNGSNQDVQYTLSGLPSWLTLEPGASTTIPARSQAPLALLIDPNVALGAYDAAITATGTTNPPSGPRTALLDVHVNVLRTPPTWAVDPADFEHSMTVRAKVYVGADSLISPDDVLAAFVGDQVRGVAHPQQVADGWRFFLTVYGKPPAFERVRFRVWDSRTSKTWVATDKTARFVPDSIVGAHGNPFEIRTRQPSPANEQVIAVNAGWTWFSVNRRAAAQDDRTVAGVLSNLLPVAGDLVKAQDGSIAMFDATAGWIGTLDTLGVTKSYRLKTAAAGEIRYESIRVLPSLYPITVKKGWNWIGYTPDDVRTVSNALGGYATSTNGDVLRSQTAFAERAAPNWTGSLTHMAPGLGYLLYRSNAADGQFTYADTGPILATSGEDATPEASAAGSTALDPAEGFALPGWVVDAHAYQYDMVVTARIAGLPLGPNHQVAALVDDEVRGVARPVHVPALDQTLVFLMVRSNRTEGETVRFQALDRTSGKVYEVVGSVGFSADAVMGSTVAPVPLRSDGNVITTIGLPAAFELGASHPNPVLGLGGSTIRYAVPHEAQVTIELFDVNGRRVRTVLDAFQAPGRYDVTVASQGLSGGVYFYRMRAGSFSATRRMVVVR